MKKILFIAAGALALSFFSGCGSKTEYVDDNNPDKAEKTVGPDMRDFRYAANEAVSDLMRSGYLARRDGNKYIMACGEVKNETMQHFDTDLLMGDIREALIKSNLVKMTAALGKNTEVIVTEGQDLQYDSRFNRSTVAKEGSLIAPDLVIFGKIIQHNTHGDGKTNIGYFFQLKISDARDGTISWEKSIRVQKVTTQKGGTW